jgi:phosphoserine phosphatase RsbU/P
MINVCDFRSLEDFGSRKQQCGVDRLCAVIRQHWDQSAEAIKQAVVNDVMTHIGTHTIYDDITLVVLKQQ